MKCPRCKDLKMKSEVYSLGSSTTLIGGMGPYWDSEGVQHSHDPNWITSHYKCSRGHQWSDTYQRDCIAKNCDWNK